MSTIPHNLTSCRLHSDVLRGVAVYVTFILMYTSSWKAHPPQYYAVSISVYMCKDFAVNPQCALLHGKHIHAHVFCLRAEGCGLALGWQMPRGYVNMHGMWLCVALYKYIS